MMSAPIIEIKAVTKFFGKLKAVDNVTLEVAKNEFFALLGPSGCGKTTLLRMIAGFSNPTEGQILIDGRDMSAISPENRPVNMVFQSYAVFPHMNVQSNVGYGLQVTGVAKPEINSRVDEALERVGLGEFSSRMPDQLSGGQRQRVALARALVKKPKVLLLDEPLSALDAKLREQMQLELANLQADVGVTFIIVTHDQDEALSMADRIAVMREGGVEQTASPGELYETPRNRFVADFIGKVNLIEGEVSGSTGGKLSVRTDTLGKVTLPFDGNAKGEICLAIRPEKINISKIRRDTKNNIAAAGKIVDWAYYGDNSHMIVASENGQRLGVVIQNTSRDSVDALDIGDEVHLSWSADDMLVLND
ncbi:MAG: ABC transporter ATP-binding protein [Rhizobiaceae bacterium]|nr:ABC transporter ATP-binding protein [Rhizobiaceae bacterium]